MIALTIACIVLAILVLILFGAVGNLFFAVKAVEDKYEQLKTTSDAFVIKHQHTDHRVNVLIGRVDSIVTTQRETSNEQGSSQAGSCELPSPGKRGG